MSTSIIHTTIPVSTTTFGIEISTSLQTETKIPETTRNIYRKYK